ncbi:unnamed protein product [Cylindrotheca closterium]|uniref:Transcription elongation factor 1 homolog n=1 Tax=Cylindrotheca closterium TaxID=2856 RepID=A0AAD2CWU2_9STRA|nr:unnamed protein product [Cylindrotheca closterium]
MGRRAKKAPVQTKKRATLAKRFKCPFCANEESVECKMDFKAGLGSLNCRICGASYQMPIHHLHEAIDVFSEWLDDCEAAATGRTNGSEEQPQQQYDEESEDDEIPEASGLQSKPAAQSNKGSAPAKQSLTDLGLDDSDSDDE